MAASGLLRSGSATLIMRETQYSLGVTEGIEGDFDLIPLRHKDTKILREDFHIFSGIPVTKVVVLLLCC
jgi:hypothetical protein